jgi:hypothetical protein
MSERRKLLLSSIALILAVMLILAGGIWIYRYGIGIRGD